MRLNFASGINFGLGSGLKIVIWSDSQFCLKICESLTKKKRKNDVALTERLLALRWFNGGGVSFGSGERRHSLVLLPGRPD